VVLVYSLPKSIIRIRKVFFDLTLFQNYYLKICEAKPNGALILSTTKNPILPCKRAWGVDDWTGVGAERKNQA
jgi:hypothetical protein